SVALAGDLAMSAAARGFGDPTQASLIEAGQYLVSFRVFRVADHHVLPADGKGSAFQGDNADGVNSDTLSGGLSHGAFQLIPMILAVGDQYKDSLLAGGLGVELRIAREDGERALNRAPDIGSRVK